jgi:hypothetical protein
MKKTQDISQIFRQLRVPASAKLDERVHREIDNAAASPVTAPAGPEVTLGRIFALFLKRPSARYTLATTVVLAVLVALALVHSTPSAWAMDQAVEALKKYRGLEMSGNFTADDKTSPIELWLRAEVTGNFVEADLGKVGDVATVWTADNKTYTYVRDDKTVYVEPGVTLGLDAWPGPELLTQLSKVKDYKAIEGDDPATGRKRVVVTCSSDSRNGPQSYLLDFDVRTKLLVSMKIWVNSRREGTPKYDYDKILYFEDLPDSTFDFQPPEGIAVTNMPLTIPDAGAGLPAVSDPKYGISAEGMTREEACQKILRQAWEADINYDFARIRQLCPLAADSSDDSLREALKQAGIVQLLKVGGIERTGRSKLGPLALVPSWVRAEDNTVSEIWMIVQFRETDAGTSCVLYGEHGYALNVKE